MDAEPGDRLDESPGDAGEGPHGVRRRRLVEFASEGHLRTDGQGIVLEANQVACMILDCPKEFLLGKPLGLFVAQSHRSRFYQGLAGLHRNADWDEFEVLLGKGPRLAIVRAMSLPPEEGEPGDFQWVLKDVTERRQAEAIRGDLMRRLVRAQEDERRRIARELHDSLGQLLTALLLEVRAVRDAGPLTDGAAERLDRVRGLAEEINRAAHELAVRLRPTALDDLGLQAASRAHLEEWSARTGVPAQFQAFGMEGCRFPPDVETALYRVLQEALTNVAKYAEARRVAVVIEHQGGRVILAVEDDGAGFDTDEASARGRLGLLGMRERMALLGGTLELESRPGAGTTVIARVSTNPVVAAAQA
ncbi:Oxygen sensor histidine kinase NreB [Aquisphaera giovannonii]|uniref:histidine kinase n=1 Tax=Aquisphaera giovannonii TaxID=406548 RepID=A0A5B9W3Z7_9BACT|nr:ATP-binding protein [Aquisphaera giovannonii]QEH34815.1 Oxygen sensor histidine kinase NreB [Aquisphaera giovannonii]